MIFKPLLASAILAGRKSQTRRLIRQGEYLTTVNGGAPAVITPGKSGPTIRYEVGKLYAVCPGRGKKAIARIRIRHILRQQLQEIGPLDAAAEGVEPEYIKSPWGLQPFYLPAFRRLWDSINKTHPFRWEDDPPVWVLTFEVARKAKARRHNKRGRPKKRGAWSVRPEEALA